MDGMMVGPRLFRSRFAALLWAGGVLWTAYDVASAAPDRRDTKTATATDATGTAIDPADLAILANAGL